MKQKNVIKIINGKLCYSPATYARKYGYKDDQRVHNALTSGNLEEEKDRNGKRYVVAGDPLPGWTEDPEFVPIEKKLLSKLEMQSKKKKAVRKSRTTQEKPATVKESLQVESEETCAKNAQTTQEKTTRVPPLNLSKAIKEAALAEKAKFDLAVRKGEVTRAQLELFRECLLDGLPLYKEVLCELNLSSEDQAKLHAGLEAWIKRFDENIDKRIEDAIA